MIKGQKHFQEARNSGLEQNTKAGAIFVKLQNFEDKETHKKLSSRPL